MLLRCVHACRKKNKVKKKNFSFLQQASCQDTQTHQATAQGTAAPQKEVCRAPCLLGGEGRRGPSLRFTWKQVKRSVATPVPYILLKWRENQAWRKRKGQSQTHIPKAFGENPPFSLSNARSSPASRRRGRATPPLHFFFLSNSWLPQVGDEYHEK